MKQKAAARSVTILILAGALGVVVARKSAFRFTRSTDQKEAKPQDAVYAMLDAARAGDLNEAQFFFLSKTAAGWKIARVETSERVKTIIPYGTPVQ